MKNDLVVKYIEDLDKTNNNIDFNPVCSDGYIHVKFRDFSKTQIIEGFDLKLSFLITLIMHTRILPESNEVIKSKALQETYLKELVNCKEFIEIEKGLISIFSNCKGLKINLFYSPKHKNIPFGLITEFDKQQTILKKHLTFLIDDTIRVAIARAGKQTVLNKKFLNKIHRSTMLKNTEKLVKKSSLWN